MTRPSLLAVSTILVVAVGATVVAIKTMLPDIMQREGMVQRFKREAQTAAALSHPHVIQIYSVKETKQLVYFVMKFIEGLDNEQIALSMDKREGAIRALQMRALMSLRRVLEHQGEHGQA